MARLRSIAVVLSVAAVGSLFAMGCGDDGIGGGEDNLTPTSPKTLADQRALCVDRTKENGSARETDLATGVVRWKCGDVKGVTGKDLGQEYCEFHAVQEGKVVDKVAKSNIKPAKVECLFTGVYRDVKGGPGSKGNESYGAKLNTALTDDAGNLKDAKGVKLPALGENPFAIMNGQFNSRGAATQLLSDCEDATKDPKKAKRVNDASDECKGDNCASARDVEACTMIEGAGVGWRNSDPIICGRAARGALCGASYGELPPALDGFIMTDWKQDLGVAAKVWAGKSNAKLAPPDGCRYATVDGKQYLHMMICTPSASQVSNPKFEGQLQQMCNDVFGPQIAMTAPVGLVAKLGKDDKGFCGEFNAGAKAIVSATK